MTAANGKRRKQKKGKRDDENMKKYRDQSQIRLRRVAAGYSAAALLLTGCQILTYSTPTGERFMRGSLGATTAISALTVETDTNGVRRVDLHGYQNDSAQALGTVTEAAVKAAIQSAK
jgi:hypothetical protein